MRARAVLITGGSGEVGQALIQRLLAERASGEAKERLEGVQIISLDLKPLPEELSHQVL